MNPEITYNGISSETMGLIVEKLPDFHRAARRVSRSDIPGRSVPLIADDGGYDVYETDMRLNLNGQSLMDVYAWLRGEGWLISSDAPGYKAYVYLYDQIEDMRFRMDSDAYDSLTVTLIVEPYLREVSEAVVTLTSPGNFAGRGHDPALPEITLTGSGNINLLINDQAVLIDGLRGSITIDSEAGVAYRMVNGAMEWAGSIVTLEDGWPQLRPKGGSNLVNWSGSVTQVAIQPKWRYL